MQYLTKIAYLLFLTLIACNTVVTDSADTIYQNGTVITMENETQKASAIAVKDGKIIGIGTTSSISSFKGETTSVIDLEGKTLLPGFIDPHSHFALGMTIGNSVSLTSPPIGTIENIDDILEQLKASEVAGKLPKEQWLIGWGYDPDQLEEKRHPTRRDLDVMFPDRPVFLLHVSAHMAVVNSKALEIVGVDANTPDPDNGVIIREDGTNEPNGVLQELAMYLVLKQLPTPNPEQAMALVNKTQNLYASQGITTAQDGLTDYATYQLLSAAAATDQLKIDIELLASFRELEKYRADSTLVFGKDNNGLRVAGVKLVGDGSPQGKTAYFSKPYLTAVPGCHHECKGFPNIAATQLEELVAICYSNGIQLYSHANGDAAIDLLLDAHEKVVDSLDMKDERLRTVVIHSQFVRSDQLEKYKKYDFIPSYFSNHAFFWGDVHVENLGEERANFLSPLKTSMDMGIVCTNHTDFIITPLNQLFTVWTAVNRTARSGKIIGADERLTPYEALKTITINAAYQHKTEDRKGSLAVGKVADFVILDKNPLTIAPNDIKDIQVMETIKEGISIYKK